LARLYVVRVLVTIHLISDPIHKYLKSLTLRMNKISSCFDHIGILLIIQMFLVVSGGAGFTFSINKNISDSTYTTNSTNTTISDSPQSIEHECTIYMAMSTIPNAGFGV